MATNPLKDILRRTLVGATGINNTASVRNMNIAKSPANILARSRSLADYGINLQRYHDPLERYLKRVQYVNPYVRKKTT